MLTCVRNRYALVRSQPPKSRQPMPLHDRLQFLHRSLGAAPHGPMASRQQPGGAVVVPASAEAIATEIEAKGVRARLPVPCAPARLPSFPRLLRRGVIGRPHLGSNSTCSAGRISSGPSARSWSRTPRSPQSPRMAQASLGPRPPRAGPESHCRTQAHSSAGF